MIFGRWPLVTADLLSEYRIDVNARAKMMVMTWRTLRTAIGGLFSTESRIARALNREHERAKGGGARGAGRR